MNAPDASRRAVIYVRVSVDRDEQTSTDSQERTARAYAESKGWTVVAAESDKGRSAYKAESRRPGLDRAMQMLETGAADTLIVWKLDRFVRSVAHFGKLWAQLEAAGASFVSVTDSFDTTTAMGRAMLQIAVAFAELESGIKSERIEAWHEERTLAGSSPTGPRPFGYDRPPEGGLAINPTEATEIRKAAKNVIAGGSLSSIVADLNERKIPTASSRGTIWRNRTLRHVLTNPTTAGLRETAGLLRPGSWEPVLDREIWDQVRTILFDPDRRTSTTNTRRWLLSGHLTCGRCSGVMRPRTHAQGYRYTCTGKCALSVPANKADELVSAALLELCDRPAWKQMRAAGRSPGIDVGALEVELAELADIYAAGEMTLAEWRVMRTSITDRVAAASGEPFELPDVDDLVAAWPNLSPAARQLVITAVVDSITVGPGVRGANQFDSGRLSITWKV